MDYVEFILMSEGLVEGDETDAKRSAYVTGLDSSSFKGKLRHISQRRKDPKRQLLRIAASFVENVSVHLIAAKFASILPLTRLPRNNLLFKSALVFGNRKLSPLIPGSFARKVVHTYILQVAFAKSDDTEEGGQQSVKTTESAKSDDTEEGGQQSVKTTE